MRRWFIEIPIILRGCSGCDHMVVGLTTTYAICAFHHWCCWFNSRSGRGVQRYVIEFVRDIAAGRWFSPGLLVSSINKTDCHDITEILLKVALNTIKPNQLYCLTWPMTFFLGNVWSKKFQIKKYNPVLLKKVFSNIWFTFIICNVLHVHVC